MNNDESLKVNRFKDLALRSYERGIPCFTPFLDMAEQDLLQRGSAEYPVPFRLYGGFDGAERVVACFDAKETEPEDYPLAAVEIKAVNMKFKGTLTHRDYLGSLMGLGIERDRLGDIVVKDGYAYVFCLKEIAPFIAENCTSVGRVTVGCRVIGTGEAEDTDAKFEELVEPLASERIDVAVARLAKCSRSAAVALIIQGKVFINRRECKEGSDRIAPGDVISVRGTGKFRYEGIAYTGKKGTSHGKFLKYV
jgi:RNA-binding protein YlmH